MDKYIAALDLGSSRIKIAVAKIEDAGIKVIYFNEIESYGIRFSRLTKSQHSLIGTLLEDVRQKTGIELNAINVAYQRYPVVSFTCRADSHRTDSSMEITAEEIQELKSAAGALNENPQFDSRKYSLIGFSAQNFSVDDDWECSEEEILGMSGEEITGNFRFFCGKTSDMNTLEQSLDGFGIGDINYSFTPTNYIGNIITREEAQNGIAVIDMGSQVTSVSVFYDGALRSYYSIPFGGEVITHDIASITSLQTTLCEEIKKGFGGCDRTYLGEGYEKKIRVQTDNERQQITIEELTDYINARVKEIIDPILYFLEQNGDHKKIDEGIVLTGGSANLRGLHLWLKKYTNYPVRNAQIINSSFVFQNEDMDNVVDYCNLWCLLDEAAKKEVFTLVEDVNEVHVHVDDENDNELTESGELFDPKEVEEDVESGNNSVRKKTVKVKKEKKENKILGTVNLLFDKIGEGLGVLAGKNSDENEEDE